MSLILGNWSACLASSTRLDSTLKWEKRSRDRSVRSSKNRGDVPQKLGVERNHVVYVDENGRELLRVQDPVLLQRELERLDDALQIAHVALLGLNKLVDDVRPAK